MFDPYTDSMDHNVCILIIHDCSLSDKDRRNDAVVKWTFSLLQVQDKISFALKH